MSRFLLITPCFLLSACFYRLPVIQGLATYDAEALGRIHIGMTRSEVYSVLGEPNVKSVFNPQCEGFFYKNTGARHPQKQKATILVCFDHDKVVSTEKGRN